MLCSPLDDASDSLLSWGATASTAAGPRSPSPLGQAPDDIEIAVVMACGTDNTIWYPPKEEDLLAPKPAPKQEQQEQQQQEQQQQQQQQHHLKAGREASSTAVGDIVLIQQLDQTKVDDASGGRGRIHRQRAADRNQEPARHAKFASGELPYLHENQWDFSAASPFSKADREATRRRKLAGLEVRELPQDHPVVRSMRAAQEQQLREAHGHGHGEGDGDGDGELAAALAALPPVREFGLFATRHFRQFDCLGEYCGTVLYSGPGSSGASRASSVGGRFVASFDRQGGAAKAGAADEAGHFSRSFRDLAVDAGERGCDLRFINSFVNVAPMPNAAMRTAVVGRLPHVVVLCTQARGIAEGEEVLLDYGRR